MRRAVITGVGCVSPIGIGIEAFSESLRMGTCGIGPLALCDPRPHQCKVAAEVRDFDALRFMHLRDARALPRVVQFAVAAAFLALKDAGLSGRFDPQRTGILLGTSSGPIGYAFEQQSLFLERGARRMHPSSPAYAHNGVIASECAIQLGIHGPALTISSACTSGADAIGLGRAMIASGVVDAMFVGGADAPITPSVYAAFDRLAMMPRHFNDRPASASRPFDLDREGLVLGEGAAVLVLEAEEHARGRGASPGAEVAGYGATCDASTHFHQEPSGDDAVRAVRLALSEAQLDADSVGYVSAHGTGTRENDPFETRVLRRVLGGRAKHVPVSSSKSQFGHSLGAAGALEVAAIVAGMEGGFLPPTLNLERPDPECELLHVACEAKYSRVDVALSTSFGFGSRNAALVVRRLN